MNARVPYPSIVTQHPPAAFPEWRACTLRLYGLSRLLDCSWGRFWPCQGLVLALPPALLHRRWAGVGIDALVYGVDEYGTRVTVVKSRQIESHTCTQKQNLFKDQQEFIEEFIGVFLAPSIGLTVSK